MGMVTDTAGDLAGRADHDLPAESFESFYAASVDRVYRALAVTLGDAHLAREATDEAMARAFVRWGQIAGRDNPGGWVFRVGLNWATSWRRKVRREAALPDSERNLPATTMPEPAGTDAVAALALLPVQARAVVVCRILFDLSTTETAAVLRIAEGTVRSRLSRAMKLLRQELSEENR